MKAFCRILMFLAIAVTIGLTISVFNGQADEQILVNRPLSADDKRYEYPEQLLTLIIEKTRDKFGSASIAHSPMTMERDRTLLELIEGKNVHVMAEAPKPEWLERLIPVVIPIRKGIQGYRIFLIRKENQEKLSKIATLDEMKKIPTGSGNQWSTTRVLKENGFDVVLGSNYEGLFGMLMRNRFATFGRGINEIFDEYEARKEKFPDLAIENSLLLYIPLPTYFFVTPTKPELAKRIETGLLALIDDGTFDTFFNRHFSEIIQKANLSGRKMFTVSNPNLPENTPFSVEKFWYKP